VKLLKKINVNLISKCGPTVHNKVRELATVCLPWQQWTETSIRFDDVYYLDVVKRLREKVRRKRPELFANNSWILHHDNAPAHTERPVREFLASK
jgi:hypothetical protein